MHSGSLPKSLRKQNWSSGLSFTVMSPLFQQLRGTSTVPEASDFDQHSPHSEHELWVTMTTLPG